MSARVRRFLFSRWTIAAAAAVVVWLVTSAVVAGTTTPQRAETVVGFSPRSDKTLPSATMTRLLSTRFVAVASSPETEARVASAAGIEVDRPGLDVDITMGENTTNLTVTVVDDDEKTATRVAAAYAKVLLDDAAADPDLTAQVVVEARPTGPDRTPQRRVLMAGLAAGLALAAVVFAGVQTWQQRRRT